MLATSVKAQTQLLDSVVEYKSLDERSEYVIGEVRIYGAEFTDEKAIRVVTGLQEGKTIKIPGTEITSAIKSLWKQKLFTEIEIRQERIIDDTVFLGIHLKERPRLTRYSFKGTKRTQKETLEEKVDPFLLKGGIVTEASKSNAIAVLEKHYRSKAIWMLR